MSRFIPSRTIASRKAALLRPVVLAVLVLAALVGLSGSLSMTGATFTATSSNRDNTFATGTVSVTDDSGGSALFTITTPGPGQVGARDLLPGDSIENCVQVRYTGSLPAGLRLYAPTVSSTAPQGTDLLPYLHLRIEESPTGAFGCTGLGSTTPVWDHSRPVAQRALLSRFPQTLAQGLDVGPPVWAPGTSRTYRVSLRLDRAVPDTSAGAQIALSLRWAAQQT